MPRILYATASELVQYAADRGVSVSEADATKNITLAQDYIDNTYNFKGAAVYPESAFPRIGIDYPETTVPPPITRATLIVGMMFINGTPIAEGSVPQPLLKREVIATNKIENEYATNYAASQVQSNVILPSLVRLFTEFDLIDSMAGYSTNLYGVRG